MQQRQGQRQGLHFYSAVIVLGAVVCWLVMGACTTKEQKELIVLYEETSEQILSQLCPKDREKAESSKKYGDATLLTPHNIYLGSYWNAMDERFIQSANITKIYHFATGRPIVQIVPQVKGFYQDVIRYRVDDLESQFQKFHNAATAIHEGLENNEIILVHCMRGRSRSVSAIISYLIEYQNYTYESAHSFVKHHRPVIGPHTALQAQLELYEKNFNNKK